MNWVIDTNAIYENLETLLESNEYELVLCTPVRQELDKHKTAVSDDLRFKSRRAHRTIWNSIHKFHHDIQDYDLSSVFGKNTEDTMDNRIIACAYVNNYGIISNDLNLNITAKSLNIPCFNPSNNDNKEYTNIYRGFLEVELDNEQFIKFQTNLNENIYNLNVNEYLVMKYNEVVLQYVWTGNYHESVNPNLTFRSKALGSFKPRDEFQSIAMDSIIRNDLTILTGKAGTAKTLTALSYALQEIESGNKFDKLFIVTNNVPVKDAFYNGWVKGDLLEKLMNSSIGNILGSKLGDKETVLDLIETGQLEILPLSDIRGWQPKENSIVMVTEGQNLNVSSMQLLIERISENSKLIIDGDNLAQLDVDSFSGSNNGINIAKEVFAGQDYFGTIELQNNYRSKMSARAELMNTNK